MKMTYSDWVQTAKRKGFCLYCGSPGYTPAHNAGCTYRCPICGNRHHQAVCPNNPNRQVNAGKNTNPTASKKRQHESDEKDEEIAKLRKLLETANDRNKGAERGRGGRGRGRGGRGNRRGGRGRGDGGAGAGGAGGSQSNVKTVA